MYSSDVFLVERYEINYFLVTQGGRATQCAAHDHLNLLRERGAKVGLINYFQVSSLYLYLVRSFQVAATRTTMEHT